MLQAPSTSTAELIATGGEGASAHGFENLRITGFSLATAWHVLTLFALVPQTAALGVQGEPLVLQLSLYAAAAATFLGLIVALKPREGEKASPRRALARATAASCALACVASFFVFLSFSLDHVARIASFCTLGVADALFMTSMLLVRGFTGKRIEQYRGAVLNAALGSLIAFVVLFMVEPLSGTLFCLLPLGAYAAYHIGSARTSGNPEPLEQDPETAQARRIDPPNVETSLKGAVFHACAFGTAFGLCQSAIIADAGGFDVPTLTASYSWIPIAQLLAALALYFASRRSAQEQSHAVIVRTAASFLLAGVLISGILASADLGSPLGKMVFHVGAETLMLAGFCTYCLGFSASLPYASALQSEAARLLNANRLLCCTGLAIGLICGGMLLPAALGDGSAPFLGIGAAGLLVCLACAPSFDRLLPSSRTDKPSVAVLDAIDVENATSAKEDPLETDRPCAEEAAPTRETTAQPADVDAKSPADENASRIECDCETTPEQATRAIAEDFNLSKREHEILCYLANGHNAAFIQQELLISIHTVKTHIANIYGKIGAHSMQDVIDLVETYRTDPDARSLRGAAKAHAAEAVSKSKEKTA